MDSAVAARNRANAQHSTGPRTPEGKSRSAQNARTHGLTAATYPTDLPVPDPCAQLEFTTTLHELREEHRPATPTQNTLVHELALITWKLQYLPRVEHRLLNTPLPHETPQPNPANITPHPRLDHEADPTAPALAAHFAADRPTPLTRLLTYHLRLQARMLSLLNQLRHLKRDQQHHHDDDTGLTAQRAYNHRNRADHQALLEESRRIHQDNQHRAEAARQTTPNPTNARQTTPSPAPAQNEPTPSPRHSDTPSLPLLSVSSVSSVAEHPSPEPQSATPRHIPPQIPLPAQNEPTSPPSCLRDFVVHPVSPVNL